MNGNLGFEPSLTTELSSVGLENNKMLSFANQFIYFRCTHNTMRKK